MNREINTIILFVAGLFILSLLPHQIISVPVDKKQEVISILQETKYYQDPHIRSITFTNTAEVSRICEMLSGHIAIGCTQPHWLYSYTFDIWVSNEDQDWRNTLIHEIGHIGFRNESEANEFLNNNRR